MTVKELMSGNVKSSSEDADLATVAKIMWDGDCGIVTNRERSTADHRCDHRSRYLYRRRNTIDESCEPPGS